MWAATNTNEKWLTSSTRKTLSLMCHFHIASLQNCEMVGRLAASAVVPWMKIIGRVKRRGKNPVGCVFQTSRHEPCWLHISSSSLAIWRRNSASNSGSDDGYIIQVGSTVCQKCAPDRRSKPQNGMFQICYNATTANSECCKAITTANSQN